MYSRQLVSHSRSTQFHLAVFFLCSCYAGLALILSPHWALTADEFVFARHIYDYTRLLPYRDFAPYKSILGYYLLSIPFYFSHALLAPLFYIKDEIILINAGCIAAACYLSQALFDRKAILLSMLAVMANASFLIYAADLRVDMLTSWCCLFALLALLHHRSITSGCLLGLAFLISQKALWYIAAIDGAFLVCYGMFRQSYFSVRHFIMLNTAIIVPIIIYILIWSTLSSFPLVMHNLFYEAYIQAGIEWYTPIYLACWSIVLQQGPALFLLWPLTFTSVIREYHQHPAAQQRVFILCTASLLLLLFIHYKQAFPYNFVFTVPAFFILYADYLTWMTGLRSGRAPISLKAAMLYSAALFLAVNLLNLPVIYNMLVLLPFTIRLSSSMFSTLFIICAIAYPFFASLLRSIHIDGSYQQQNIQLAASLLDDQSSYVGGLPYFYTKDQPIAGLMNLIGPELDYIYEAKPTLKPLLLDSLYLSATTQKKIIADFENQPIKLIINNYRIHYLPPAITDYLQHHYLHYSGSIYLYAPVVSAQEKTFILKFDGDYIVRSANTGKIIIDGNSVKNADRVALKTGQHSSISHVTYRLILTPAHHAILPSQEDNWLRMLKAILA